MYNPQREKERERERERGREKVGHVMTAYS